MVWYGWVWLFMEIIMGKEEWMYGCVYYGVEGKEEVIFNDCWEGRWKVEEVREVREGVKDKEEEEEEWNNGEEGVWSYICEEE